MVVAQRRKAFSNAGKMHFQRCFCGKNAAHQNRSQMIKTGAQNAPEWI